MLQNDSATTGKKYLQKTISTARSAKQCNQWLWANEKADSVSCHLTGKLW